MARAWHRFGTLLPLLLGIGCLAALAWVNAFSSSPNRLSASISTREQLALLYAGCALVAWGAAGSPRLWRSRRQDSASAETTPTLHRRLPAWVSEVGIVLAIIVSALALRLVGLETSVRLLLDEANYLTAVSRVINTPNLMILYPMSNVSPFPWLFGLLQADAVALFGHTLTGLRGASALIGTANVVVIYWIVRMLFDRRTALIAAVVLATFPPHLHFSRIVASMTIADALMGSLVFAFIIRALKTRHPLDWGIAGAMFGLTHYFSDAGKLVYTPLVLAYLGWLVLTDADSRRAIRAGVGRMLLVTVIVAAPIYTTLYVHHRPVFGRLDASSTGGFSRWLSIALDGLDERDINEITNQIARPFRFILSEPEAEHVYYAGTEPLVMRVFVPLLLIGSAAALIHWRKPAILPLAWVLVVVLGNAFFIRNSASSPRFVVAFPPLAILMALGIAAIYALLVRLRLSIGWTRTLVVLLTGAVAIMQVDYYFGRHLDHLRYHHRRSLTYGDLWDAVLRVYEQLPHGTQGVYVSKPTPATIESSELLGFLQGGIRSRFLSYEPGQITPSLLRTMTRSQGYAFLIETRHEETIRLLYRYFPDAALPRYSTWDIAPDEQYLLVYVPPIP